MRLGSFFSCIRQPAVHEPVSAASHTDTTTDMKTCDADRISNASSDPTRSLVTHDAPATKPSRPEREVFIDFLDRLRHHQSRAARNAFAVAQKAWFAEFSNTEVRRTLHVIGTRFGHDPEVRASVEHAIEKMPGKARPTFPSFEEYHVNQYGRTFESLVATKLVERLPAAAFEAGRRQLACIQDELGDAIGRLNLDKRSRFFEALEDCIQTDLRQWMKYTPQIEQFLTQQSSSSFLALFDPPRDGYDIIAGQYAAVKSAVDLDRYGVAPVWHQDADDMYPIIKSARSTCDTGKTHLTRAPGINLIDQPKVKTPSNYSEVLSWADAKLPTFDDLSESEKLSLRNGQIVVCGVSGSTNILGHLNKMLAKRDPAFDADAAMLNTLIFLTLDGGHSFNEVSAVHRALGPKTADMRSAAEQQVFRKTLNDHLLKYSDIICLMPPGENRKIVDGILQQALHETIDSFSIHGYRRPSFDESGNAYASFSRQFRGCPTDGLPQLDLSAAEAAV